MNPLLVGIHDAEGAAVAPPNTWVLDTVALSQNPAPVAHRSDLHWITRLNWGYGPTGTLPTPDQYPDYVAQASRFVRSSTGCRRWIVGNEPNHPVEWPRNQAIYPSQYANCFLATRSAIRSLSGHEQDEVLIAAPGPWNAELHYMDNPTGDWLHYFTDVIAACNGQMDGFSLHAYTHNLDPTLVTSEARMAPPFQNHHYEFRVYQDYCNAIPDVLAHLPIYITEANGNGPWQATGLMPAMVREIADWNLSSSARKIHSCIFYRYPNYDRYGMAGKPEVIAEYLAAANTGLRSTTYLPSIGVAPVIDPRAAARGVFVTPFGSGEKGWRVTKVQWYDEQEADRLGPDHHIMVDVLDEQGQRVVGVTLLVTWPSGSTHITTEAKPGEPYSANYPMTPSKNEFSVQVVDDLPSEIVSGIGMGAGDPFNPGAHTTTGVIFQRTSAITLPPPVQSDTWTRSRAFVRKWEGGFQKIYNDRGNWTSGIVGVGQLKGTKFGITAASYPTLDIENLTLEQADAIYQTDYWQASGASELPWPGCLIVFDTAVLHGVGTAKNWLKEFGPNPMVFAAKRLASYAKSDNWNDWGKAWVQRVSELLLEAARS